MDEDTKGMERNTDCRRAARQQHLHTQQLTEVYPCAAASLCSWSVLCSPLLRRTQRGELQLHSPRQAGQRHGRPDASSCGGNHTWMRCVGEELRGELRVAAANRQCGLRNTNDWLPCWSRRQGKGSLPIRFARAVLHLSWPLLSWGAH